MSDLGSASETCDYHFLLAALRLINDSLTRDGRRQGRVRVCAKRAVLRNNGLEMSPSFVRIRSPVLMLLFKRAVPLVSFVQSLEKCSNQIRADAERFGRAEREQMNGRTKFDSTNFCFLFHSCLFGSVVSLKQRRKLKQIQAEKKLASENKLGRPSLGQGETNGREQVSRSKWSITWRKSSAIAAADLEAIAISARENRHLLRSSKLCAAFA